ncbi:MAG: glycosyltransferase [Paludibacteraceae bacterium]|nr:glycosyltransferase [Paludibacteraceae bacterium]
MQPIITIGIPIYNVEQYVEKALLSALNQSFALPYEILVVDDRGTDNSMSIVNDLKQSHPRGNCIRIVEHRENSGPGCAKTTIIENALGTYLSILDSDDWIDEKMLDVLYTKAIETDAELVVADVVHVYDDTYWQRTHYKENYINHKGAGAYAISHKIENIHQEWWGKLWSVDFLRKTHIYNDFRIMDDVLPHFRMCAEVQKVAWVSYVVYYYRIRSNSLMTSVFYEKVRQTITAYVETIEEAKTLLQGKYCNIDGIYDMFVDRVRDAVSNIASLPIDDSEKQTFGAQIYDFSQYIPSIKVLHNKHNRLAYLICRNRDTYSQAKLAFLIAPKKLWGRLSRNLLGLL